MNVPTTIKITPTLDDRRRKGFNIEQIACINNKMS